MIGEKELVIGRGESGMVVGEVSTTGSGTDWSEWSSSNSVMSMTVHIFASRVKIVGVCLLPTLFSVSTCSYYHCTHDHQCQQVVCEHFR